ncbi:MAG TPA: carboxypeptidase-like regulatory domain-containing protein [Candidatus Thermoplasmatota archaeon]|nr:carboxypeptidase-like regulatory domain-containing protein [Candidatus Thermoplasmatota archaeon]
MKGRPSLRSGLLTATLLATVLAGCTGGGEGADPGEEVQADFDDLDLEATATTGVIRGIVVDEAIRPLGGADVGTSLPDGAGERNATSSADGAFGFDGLPPGTYFLTVRKAGFLTQQASTEVVAGVSEPPVVKVLLTADPATIPYTAAFQFDAFLACSFTLVLVSFAACGLAAEQTDNRFLVEYDADKPPKWIQTEAVWSSTQPLGSSLSMSITDFSTGAQVRVNATAGESPIYTTVNETQALQFNYTGADANPVNIRLFSTSAEGTDLVPQEVVHEAWAANGYPVYNSTGLDPTVDNAFGTAGLINPLAEDCIRWVTLFSACMGAGGIGVVLEQRVTVYTHFFYGYLPPSDWRFSADGAPPGPPA